MNFCSIFGLLFAILAVFAACPASVMASRDARPVNPWNSPPRPKQERPFIYDAPIRMPGPKTMYA